MARLLLLAGILTLVVGCPSVIGLPDPASTAPQLAGRWALTGRDGRQVGCLTSDMTGDPISLRGNPEVLRAVGEEEVFFDGIVRATASGLDYAAVGSASIEGDQVIVSFEIQVFLAGLPAGTQRFVLEGTLTDPASVEGTFESTQEATFADVPSALTEDGRATRDGC